MRPPEAESAEDNELLHYVANLGRTSVESNEELGVWLEAAGIDVDDMRREIEAMFTMLGSTN